MNAKKHWTSMFIKSNSSTSLSHQLPETSDSSAMRLRYSELDETSHNYGLEREMSQPKGRTRWNPKPEQIRILEAIFQSGLVSPPREEIKRIRAQLEVFGQVGDANVYYWFQNRKSRSKRKPRLPAAQRSKSRTQSGTVSSTSSTSTSTSVHSKTATEISNSAPSFMQKNIGDQYFSPSPVPVYDIQAVYEQMSKTSTSAPSSSPPTGDQYCFSSAPLVYSSAGNHYNLHTSTSVPYETLPNPSNCAPSAMPDNIGDQYCFSSAAAVDSSAGHDNDLRTMSNMQAIGAAEAGTQSILNEGIGIGIGGVQDGSVINPNPSIIVFINDVPTSVPSGPINLRDFFGADALIFDSSGESVLVNEFGFTSLDAGATYFLI